MNNTVRRWNLRTKMNRLSMMGLPFALIACAQAASASVIDVVKNPNCGCCVEWVERMREAGFVVQVRDVEDTSPYAQEVGVPGQLRSCHTATVDGYAIEGHVPAADIKRLLEEKPSARGLAVPGMPIGSPGMEMGGRSDRYHVVLISDDGNHTIYATHGGSVEAHRH